MKNDTDTTDILFKDLSADELAEHAFNVFLYQGRHPLGARLIYAALKQDRTHPLALRCLADLLNQDGLEVFAAVTLEYALIHAQILEEFELKALYRILFASKWSWGFSLHRAGKKELQSHDFDIHENFIVDHERYQAFIDQIILRAGNLESAFRSSLTICGIMAHFLTHKEADKTTSFDEIFYPDRFVEAGLFSLWLESYEPALDELSAKRLIDQMQRFNDFNKNIA